MSSNYWQTRRQIEPLQSGNTTTISRIEGYIKTWMERCYSDGIPDVVSDKLMASNRVPSYKAIAMAILKNESSMQSLGYVGNVSGWFYVLKQPKVIEDNQLSLSL